MAASVIMHFSGVLQHFWVLYRGQTSFCRWHFDGDGNDYYYVKAAKGFDDIDITDGPGDDLYKVRATFDATLDFVDSPGDDDFIKTKPRSLAP